MKAPNVRRSTMQTTGCSSARLEYTSGGRVVAGSNPVIPTKLSRPQERSCAFLFLYASRACTRLHTKQKSKPVFDGRSAQLCNLPKGATWIGVAEQALPAQQPIQSSRTTLISKYMKKAAKGFFSSLFLFFGNWLLLILLPHQKRGVAVAQEAEIVRQGVVVDLAPSLTHIGRDEQQQG